MPVDGPPFRYKKVSLEADDLAEAMGLNVYKFRVGIRSRAPTHVICAWIFKGISR
ncbi:hypothetical protein FRUB_05140 [Fimbriiglobus ruber]|uniref:Uncharacterized protein n=2 Tax=Fimbriiglobus ruber TaxID=1908690 RepID=A0A225DF83_9BACT|nr:hypothetical protein FRUB_05140 [Fimbriiglobus ruber]